MRQWFLMAIALLVLAGCYATPRGGGVTPYPPGPIDTLSILLSNDYSRLCPAHYEYCRAGKRSVCCPRGACCDDGEGPYCCDSGGYGGDRDRADAYSGRAYDRRAYESHSERAPCGRGTTCSRGGLTICCAEQEGCCSDDEGLYCCRGTGRGY